MAQIPDKITKIVNHFISELENNGIPITNAYIFGSYASEKHDKWSDIDIAIVSDAFEGDRFEDRNKIRKLKLSISSDLEPHPYRPDDFNMDDPFIKNIVSTGIAIKGEYHFAKH